MNGITGSKVLRILKKNGGYLLCLQPARFVLPSHMTDCLRNLSFVCVTGLAPAIPEDLYYMIKKAVVMRKHLEQNRKDKDGKFRLILVESRIHRLARYYKVGLLSLMCCVLPSSASLLASHPLYGLC